MSEIIVTGGWGASNPHGYDTPLSVDPTECRNVHGENWSHCRVIDADGVLIASFDTGFVSLEEARKNALEFVRIANEAAK